MILPYLHHKTGANLITVFRTLYILLCITLCQYKTETYNFGEPVFLQFPSIIEPKVFFVAVVFIFIFIFYFLASGKTSVGHSRNVLIVKCNISAVYSVQFLNSVSSSA